MVGEGIRCILVSTKSRGLGGTDKGVKGVPVGTKTNIRRGPSVIKGIPIGTKRRG